VLRGVAVFNLCDESHIFNYVASCDTIWHTRVPNLFFFVFLLLFQSVFEDSTLNILTAMRGEVSEYYSDETDAALYCKDEDYETAEVIGSKMLMHMAASYRMIDGDAQDVIPEIKPIDQRKVLFEQLKGEYKLSELIEEAKTQGVSRRSAIRWNDSWQENGMILKTDYGHYKKVG